MAAVTAALVVDGVVREVVPEVIVMDGVEYGLADRYPAEDVTRMMPLAPGQAQTVKPGWIYDGMAFVPPQAPEVEQARPVILKADIFRRATDAEAKILMTTLAKAPPRLRGIYEGANYLDPADPDFAHIQAAIVAALGDEQRAAELLAPS